MALYTAQCPSCNHQQDYIRKIADRENTPLCDQCGTKTVKAVTACMVPVMAMADSMHVVSPIDGTVMRNRYDYESHMKKHNVRPTSEFEGVKREEPKVSTESIRQAATQAYDKLVGN